MNLDVTISATRVLRVLVVRWTSRLVGAHAVIDRMTGQAEVIDRAELQHSRIGGSVRHVTRNTAVGLDRSVLESKRPLLIRVTLDARRVSANRQPRNRSRRRTE